MATIVDDLPIDAPVESSDSQIGGVVKKGSEHQGKFMYWRKAEQRDDGSPAPDAGYVVIGPAWPIEVIRQLDKGMSRLAHYGRFDLQEGGEGGNVNLDPWRRLLRNGGAKEFPVTQLVEMGWHRAKSRPPYARRMTFPQLKGALVNESACKTCGKLFSSLGDSDMLLAKHERTAHRDTSQEQGLTRALSEAQAQMSGPLSDTLGVLKQQIEQQGMQQSETAQALLKLAEALIESNNNNKRERRSP